MHVFNFNEICDLPFGGGRRFLHDGGVMNRSSSGLELTSMVRVSFGAPFSIPDTLVTMNRTGRSARQTAPCSISKDQIRDWIFRHASRCVLHQSFAEQTSHGTCVL